MIIDGRRITPQAGASILETAREVGSAIPTLCHHPGLPSDGSCRMCLVEVDVLTNAALDPIAKIPEFKVCAVGIEPAAEAAR